MRTRTHQTHVIGKRPRSSAASALPSRTSTHSLPLRYHSSVLLPIICLCQTRLRPSPCSSSCPPTPSYPLCFCRSQRCLRRITAPWVGNQRRITAPWVGTQRRITAPWVGTQPTDTRLQHPWSDGQRFSRWSLRCCAVPSQPHSSPPPQHEQLEFPMRLSLAQTKPQ
jgi:hypothetical protein